MRRTRTKPVGKVKARQRVQDRSLRREARVQRPATRFEILRRRVGWPLAALGVLLFTVGWLGAASGVQVLPFDSHHTVSQLGGGLLVTNLLAVPRRVNMAGCYRTSWTALRAAARTGGSALRS